MKKNAEKKNERNYNYSESKRYIRTQNNTSYFSSNIAKRTSTEITKYFNSNNNLNVKRLGCEDKEKIINGN